MAAQKVFEVIITVLWLNVYSLLGVDGRGYSFTYVLEARHVECFHERLVNGSRLEVDYQVNAFAAAAKPYCVQQ